MLIEAYEWTLTLGDADAAVDAVLGIAELNGLQIDSVEVQTEIAATLAQIEKV
jgi:acetolactate synthase regulatory subunit